MMDVLISDLCESKKTKTKKSKKTTKKTTLFSEKYSSWVGRFAFFVLFFNFVSKSKLTTVIQRKIFVAPSFRESCTKC